MTAVHKGSLTTLVIPKSPTRPLWCFPGPPARLWVRTGRPGGQGHQARRSAAVLPSCPASPGTAAHRGGHMADGTSSCAPARCSRALPLDDHRDGVQRQRRTASCHPRSAVCGRAALCASGLGEWGEHHLFRRGGVLEQHAEHHQDGVEGSHHLWPAVGAVSAHTPASARDGTLEAHRLGYIAEAGRARPRPPTAREHTAPCRVCSPRLSGPLRRRQRLAMYPHSS